MNASLSTATPKQRPPTAKGFAFYVLEDGPLHTQTVTSPDLWQYERHTPLKARILVVSGHTGKRGKAWTVRAGQLADAQKNIVINGSDII